STLTSGFLSRKAWNGPPEQTKVHRCPACDFRFHDRGLSDREATSFYDGYRTDRYLEERRTYEPFYTAGLHRDLETFLSSKGRRDQLLGILKREGAPAELGSVLDWGGGSGVLVSELPAALRATFDISGAPVVPGVKGIPSADAL